MIAVILGLPGSASTWLFNVVRELVATLPGPAVSLYADRASDLLAALAETNAAHVVVKAHARMMAVLRLAGGRLIASTRDSRDSLLSMQDRFGHSAYDVTRQIALSAASVAYARDAIAHLHLTYESRFTHRKATIAQIASFLEIDCEKTREAELFAKLKRTSVRSHTALLAAQGYTADCFDPATHWHPNHVGDGKVEKWNGRLPPERAEAYLHAFAALCSGYYREPGAIGWTCDFFRYHDERDAIGSQELAASDAVCLVHGPHFYLPAGRWRAVFALRPRDDATPPRLQIEIISEGVQVLAMKQTTVASAEGDGCSLEFEARDHMLPLEARVHSTGQGPVAVIFEGVSLEWIAPLPVGQGIARPL